MKTNRKPFIILGAGLVIFLGSALLFGLPQVKRAAQIGTTGRARAQMAQWAHAAEAYREAHGAFPAGEPEVILETLRRATPSPASRAAGLTNQLNQIYDPWGTPWMISSRTKIEVRSAGPNRQFGDEDDLSSLSLGIK